MELKRLLSYLIQDTYIHTHNHHNIPTHQTIKHDLSKQKIQLQQSNRTFYIKTQT